MACFSWRAAVNARPLLATLTIHPEVVGLIIPGGLPASPWPLVVAAGVLALLLSAIGVVLLLQVRRFSLARERYQLGAATFVELVDAQTVLAQAEADRVRAIFAYHDAVTTLEGIVGVALR